ncbi:MAG TPA: VOC family protein [Dictyobacter sp.]|jgi:predicted enzyme related to lactoylglutathione lyase|nr:VOC family protein [Dictyobacter sp.]
MELISLHTLISIFVDDQEEALRFYTEQLGLEKRMDQTFAPGLRLVTVAAYGQLKPELALATLDEACYGREHVGELQRRRDQFISSLFRTTDCQKDYEELRARGVQFLHEPRQYPHSVEAVFADPYGNTFLLLEIAPEYSILPSSLQTTPQISLKQLKSA